MNECHISFINLRRMADNNPNVDLVNINAYIQHLVEFNQFVHKILGGNEILKADV